MDIPDPQQRQRFMAEHPDQIGNLNGVPILARNDANLTVMNQDLDRVRASPAATVSRWMTCFATPRSSVCRPRM